MRRIALGLCLLLGLASICVGSAWIGSKLAMGRLATNSLPADLRSELEADYRGEGVSLSLPPLEPGVSEQARQDAADLAVRYSWPDLEFVPVFSSLPDWQAVPTPGWLLTPTASAPAQEPVAHSTPPGEGEQPAEGPPPASPRRNTVVVRFGPYPDADTYISEEASNTNHSGVDELRVSSTTGRRERTLVGIRPLGLTAQGEPERAVLHIYMASSAGTGESVMVNRVMDPWDAATATWQAVAGGRYDPEAVASIDISSTGWKAADITTLVRGWLQGSVESYGVILTAPGIGEDVAVTFHSGNHPDPLLRPWLEVTFIAGSD